MRFCRWMVWVLLAACGDAVQDGAHAGQGGNRDVDAGQRPTDQGGAGGRAATAGQVADGGSGGSEALRVPRIYPIVRAGTPSGLIADPADKSSAEPSLDVIDGEDAGISGGSSNTLAHIVQDRLYSPGPTALLRIVRELDLRTAQLDTDSSKHACLLGTPVSRSWTFPGAQTFNAQLQCISQWSGGWLAFGFAPMSAEDEDAGAAHSGDDFYLVEGQEGGMGGAYRVHASGNVEAWITVADRRAPSNSQVIMHLVVDAAASSTELAFGGSGVGFCSAHLKTDDNYLFIHGKPNAPPPPGAPNGHYCASEQAGCFSATELNVDLGPAAISCSPITSASFAISAELEASAAPEGNVDASKIYKFFDTMPEGVPAF